MHMHYNNPNCVYTMNNVDVNVVSEMNDLGITVKKVLILTLISTLLDGNHIVSAITSSTVFILNLLTF